MQDLFPVQHSYLIPLLPLLGAMVAGFFGARWLKGQSHWPIWIGVGASAVLSLWLLFGMLGHWTPHHGGDGHAEGAAVAAASAGAHGSAGGDAGANPLVASVKWFDWINIGGFNVEAGALIDPLTAVMLCVVCGIGFFITVFAAGYMKGEEGYFRFFAYLGLFIFAMTCLVMGNNLVMLYLGWEGVGVCSYLLIGYYYDKPSAREAAKKAFLVNRVGDLGFGLGIMLCYLAFGTVSYFAAPGVAGDGLLERAADLSHPGQWAAAFIPFLLMVGAFGKSAQFPLHVWLPDAMEGPTPVSALIHAATMVTAGVYMIARCGTLFVANEAAMWTVAIIGAFTAVFAATIALRQFDLKKVFAYSTVSQLGFMFVGVGVLAPVAGVFHLVTHAFFKALLFLSSGVVMHAMAGELDMRKFSGLKKQLPKTRWLMLIGCLALAGVPPMSGFFSKDEILAAAWEQNLLLGLVMLFTAFMTAYYTFRLYFRVFEGPEILPAGVGGGHGHGGHGTHAPDHGAASHSAIEAGDAHQSGVDTHLATDAAHHGQAVHDSHGGGHGHGHGDHGHHNHEPAIMILPLIVLAIGSVLAGALVINHGLADFLGNSPSFAMAHDVATSDAAHWHHVNPAMFGQTDVAPGSVETWSTEAAEGAHTIHVMMMVLSTLGALAGIYLAYVFHLKDRTKAERLAASYGGVARVLEAKYWVDEVYQNGIVEPLRGLGRAFFALDRFVVDGLVNTLGFAPQLSGLVLKLTTQRGYLQGYAVTMLFGIVVILLVIFL